MLRVVAHTSAAAAQQYFAEGLKREDYYSEGQEVVGKWHGKAAVKLGVSGDVTPDAFAALTENRHPVTGDKLTPRTKVDRRVGYDLNFHAPKSLSLLQALTDDKAVLKAFRAAVAETMQELEERAETRVRKGGAQNNRVTGNLAWAEFVHFTSRPVGGIPDPHLHVHCFTFNSTFDAVEARWKAAEMGAIKKEAPYYEAAFHARLAAKIEALGYATERSKFGWEVAGIPRTMIEKFSRRTALIDELAAEKGIRDPRAKDALGASTREGKRRGLSKIDLLTAWGARLSDQEKVILARVHGKMAAGPTKVITARDAVDYSFEKLFARDAVVPQNRIVSEALRFGVGKLEPEKIWRELAKRQMVTREINGEVLCTSLSVLAEEVALINFVRTGRGNWSPLGPRNAVLGNQKLSGEQAAAVRHVLGSRDQVIAIRGGAGVGKTTLMKEVAAQIAAAGSSIYAFAPSASASRGTLRESGFQGADTVANLLLNPKLQAKVHGKVIWVDEAGLLGTRELWEIMQLAGNSTRVILTGDSGQHAPVARGDAFRLLQRYAGLRIAEVTEIRRQQVETYKFAVAALAKGDLQTGFQRLDELGAIIESDDAGKRYGLLAKEYMELSRKGPLPLVVSPTHAESAKVTAAIRDAKREAGQVKGERQLLQYHNLQWESADKKRAENYAPGMKVQFHQNAKGVRKGELFTIKGLTEKGGVKMTGPDGREISLPLKSAAHFQVYEERQITLGKGDQVRITRNGTSADGRRINNGDGFAIKGFSRKGEIILSNGAVLPANHGHLTHGYCQTSHSSQSKSVGNVLVAQSSESFVASSREQFYVSISRGQQTIKLFTDNRKGLQEAVGNSATRTSAMELAQISRREFTAMSTAMNSRQWRDQIKSRKAEGKAMSHVKTLLKARQQDGQRKSDNQSWRQYVEMRRGISGPDGKSRSKSHPGGTKQKRMGSIRKQGKSFIRPTQMRTATAKRTEAVNAKPAPEKQQKAAAKKPSPRTERLEKAYRSSARHLGRIAERTKSGRSKLQSPAKKEAAPTKPAKAPVQKPKTNIATAAKHASRQREATAKAKKQVQQTKAKAMVPKPPSPRK